MLVKARWASTLAIVCITTCGVTLSAEDKGKEKSAAPQKAAAASSTDDSKKDEAKKEDAGAKADDRFTVPKDATSSELVKYIKKVTEGRRPQFKSREEFLEYMKQLAAAVVEASSLALESKDVSDEDAAFSLRWQFQALGLQRQLQIEGADKAEVALAEKYKDDKREAVARLAKHQLLSTRITKLNEAKPEEQNQIVEEAVSIIKGDGKLTRESAQAAMEFGSLFEQSGNDELAATAHEKFAEIFENSDDEKLKKIAPSLQGTARRLRLTGSKLELDGTLVGGEAFNWSKYEGKVVLVDFWATWCGPCIAEMPNVRQNYNGYHSKGFEIVGISLDSDEDKLKSFIKKNKVPWDNLFSTDEMATGWSHPLATKYGVHGIPFTILVGKDGKVISTGVRGPALGKALAEQLGEPDEAALKAALEEDAKADIEELDESEKKEKKDQKEKGTKGE